MASSELATVETEAYTPATTQAPNTGVPHLEPHEIIDILRWDAQGLTQEQIANKFNPPRTQATICRTLQKYGADTRPEAKRILAAGSATAALTILKDGRPRDLIQVLQGVDVLTDQDVKGGLTIVVGGSAQVQVNVGTGYAGPTLSPSVVVDAGETGGNV